MAQSASLIKGFPRARGDVPPVLPGQRRHHRFSPRTRGCSHFICFGGWVSAVFPAHAGMFLIHVHVRRSNPCFPRARGDVPLRGPILSKPTGFSPRTRGCSLNSGTATGDRTVFPAHAGMFLTHNATVTFTLSFPRARGDVPHRQHQGGGGCLFSPRTRGCSPY